MDNNNYVIRVYFKSPMGTEMHEDSEMMSHEMAREGQLRFMMYSNVIEVRVVRKA